jgi:hypothetical protein
MHTISDTVKASKTAKQLQFLLTAAVMFSGFLAGGNLDRYIVQVPGFRHISVLTWAQYSRHADLGNGMVLYPLEAVGGFVLFVVSAVLVFTHKNFFKRPAMPVYAAAILSALGLFFTIFAAPIMLGLRTINSDQLLLQNAFDRFHFWGMFRAVAQIFSFFAGVIALQRMPGTTTGAKIQPD